ncbi:exodeoxyribonuclease V subunit beta [Mannheimia sp. AT1]|uniref:RecBCD enzyme subunit RecB n=1 Tax=Mannheimia cairinae TaxID=3025936 RepID=A0ABT5MPR6_9PAST|nr:exodeoxyribonuclease V subunit beta [Mannheimia cairinae]MDD0823586.1 exodeoxyribonuclease V subunit beta [Mannheimia cairinae]MDD0825482.1 exodeoxyribonuclease V subunit beta [Mannheimia cairinae]
MQNLNPIKLPLNQSVLIEASAGTGKTFTIANLYLRLLLGVGCEPLTVEQILVVTFTKAATEELKDRIRQNIQACRAFILDNRNNTLQENASYRGNEEFLSELYQQILPLDEALLRLSIAEREVDTASVFTIHGFCQKMLVQFAFESGVRFDLDLQPNQSELLKRLSEEVWREQFYPQGVNATYAISSQLSTPANALAAIRDYLPIALPEPSAFLGKDFVEHLTQYQNLIKEIKTYWLSNKAEIIEILLVELNKTYKKGQKKSLSRRSYQERFINGWVANLDIWVESKNDVLPVELFSRFCQEMIAEKAEEGAEILESPHFAKNQAFLTAYQENFENSLKPILLYQFLIGVKEKLVAYKQSHPERSFDDLLIMLNQALKQPATGKVLAEKIRSVYPFAMIDEFQDTDLTQYEIFSQIFMVEQANKGFIMIGDPKQSIYKFRGADIFTYLKAAQQTNAQFTLAKNWRSLPEVVQAVNNLFNFANSEKSPFIYQGIDFHPVTADENKGKLISHQGHFVCHTAEKTKLDDMAEICAYQIHQQLNAMKAGQFGIEKNGEFKPFAAKDIAILVRKGSQATRIKRALAKRSIKSVYLAESEVVFSSEIASELCWLLQAAQNPYHYQALLSALGSTFWGMTAAEIYRYKENEMLWETKVNQFVEYSAIWKTHGILPMLHKIYLEQGIIQRLKGMVNADRLITDLLHLTEILQEKSQDFESEAELVHWFERQLSSPEANDEQKLRLESEEELIKIITIHGSKGLQYPIVWLPFASQKSEVGKPKEFGVYRNQAGKLNWYIGTADDEVKNTLQNEEYAEDLRLFYVALTRAESQLNLVLPTEISGFSPLHYLLTNGNTENEKINVAEKLATKGIEADLVAVEKDLPESRWQNDETEESYQAKTFTGNIRVVGQITSFSSLYAQHERFSEGKINLVTDFAQDRDIDLEVIETDYLANDATEPFSPFQFPHGIKVGTILHSFFEHCQFGKPIEQEAVTKVCEQLELNEEWIEPTQAWFERILETPLAEANFKLKEVNEKQCLNEWQFYLRLKNEKALIKLNQLLKQHTTLAKHLPELQLPQLEGFVRGFVDCIVQMNGKFYLIDYKSNFLGFLPQNYMAENLKREMGRQRYDLQYLLYTLAVHRYLKSRLGENYDYERDFGGVAYLFLRAMDGTTDNGVYFDKPSKILIEEMDTLFG